MYNEWFEIVEKQLQEMKQVLGEENEEYIALMQECQSLEEKMTMAEQGRVARIVDVEERKLIVQWEALEARIQELLKSPEYRKAKIKQDETMIGKYISVLEGKLGKAEIASIDTGIEEVLKALETVSKDWTDVEGKKVKEEMTRLTIDRNIVATKQGKPIRVEGLFTLCGEKTIERLFTEKCQELVLQEGMSEEEKWKINMLLMHGVSIESVKQEEIWKILAGVETVTIEQQEKAEVEENKDKEKKRSDSYIIARIQKPNGKIIEKKVSVRRFERNGNKLPKDLLKGLVGVTIPSGVKEIGFCAFDRCKDLEEVTLSEGLEKISNCAFRQTGIKRLTIPASVKRIAYSAFFGCKDLEEVMLSEGLEEINEQAFRQTGIKRLTIPRSLKEIHAYVFSECKDLEEVIVPERLMLNVLSDITLPENVKITVQKQAKEQEER